MAVSDWIRFQKVFGFGTVRAAKALSYWGNPAAIFDSQDDELLKHGVLDPEIEKIHLTKEKSPDKILEFCAKNKIRILTPEEIDYPDMLREIYSPPAVLYVAGSWENLQDRLCIAVVGTRQLTPYGDKMARYLSCELARNGIVTVSGLAAGVDSCCHSATLLAGGKTIAVQGCGIDRCYPATNDVLKTKILENGGAVLTEFPPGTEPLAYHFPIRNRIIAGLCHGTVVVEGQRKSGSLITAGFALTEGRDVFAIPGNVDQMMSEAPNWLIREGAIMVRSTDDILQEYEHLEWKECRVDTSPRQTAVQIETYYSPAADQKEKKARTREVPQKENEHLNENQRRVLAILSSEPVDTDTILQRCGLPISTVLSVLTQLEIFGIIKIHAGHRFSL